MSAQAAHELSRFGSLASDALGLNSDQEASLLLRPMSPSSPNKRAAGLTPSIEKMPSLDQLVMDTQLMRSHEAIGILRVDEVST